MKFTLITLFPEEIKSSISFGVLGRAIKNKVIEIDYISLRDYSNNKYQSIDDKPYGGGPGMLIQAKPLIKAITKIRNERNKNIPVIFYFNGTHEDYHAPGDTPDKINYEMLAKRSQLIFHTAWELANRNDRIKIN